MLDLHSIGLVWALIEQSRAGKRERDVIWIAWWCDCWVEASDWALKDGIELVYEAIGLGLVMIVDRIVVFYPRGSISRFVCDIVLVMSLLSAYQQIDHFVCWNQWCCVWLE